MDSKNFFDMFTGNYIHILLMVIMYNKHIFIFLFIYLLAGKLKPANAFMMGKLKITGDLQKAMKLEKLMKSLKSKL